MRSYCEKQYAIEMCLRVSAEHINYIDTFLGNLFSLLDGFGAKYISILIRGSLMRDLPPDVLFDWPSVII